MYILDRRLNPGGKSLVNRQRFLRRAKALVQQAVRDSLKDRSIKELEQEGGIAGRAVGGERAGQAVKGCVRNCPRSEEAT